METKNHLSKIFPEQKLASNCKFTTKSIKQYGVYFRVFGLKMTLKRHQNDLLSHDDDDDDLLVCFPLSISLLKR